MTAFVLVVFLQSWILGTVVDQKVVLETDTLESCETARSELLKMPGYYPTLVKCLPGRKPTADSK